MKPCFLVGAVAAVGLAVVGATAQTFTIVLDGNQQVPPATTTAVGTGYAIYEPTTNRLTLHVDFSGFVGAETLAHIHRAPAGENGPIIINLPLGTPIDATRTLSEFNEAELLAGNLYVNLHSTVFPAGELRGQIIPGPFRGACCMKAGGCVEGTADECAVMQGSYQGDNTRCVDVCGAPMVGACCLGTACEVLSSDECTARGGEYEGNGSFCSAGTCQPPPACPCDVNFDLHLNSQDYFDFLTGFFQGMGDFNMDGITNSQDFFDFLTCFFLPPNGC